MFTLVIGGAASGKSEYAEARALSLPGKRVYLATMRPSDGECLMILIGHINQFVRPLSGGFQQAEFL